MIHPAPQGTIVVFENYDYILQGTIVGRIWQGSDSDPNQLVGYKIVDSEGYEHTVTRGNVKWVPKVPIVGHGIAWQTVKHRTRGQDDR